MTKHFDVIIVGLGPVGTLLTLLLNQAGIKVLGIDKDISIFPLPRAANIDDEGLRIMQRVNLESAYSDHSSNPSGAIFTDKNLNRLSGMDLPDDFYTGNGWLPTYFFWQPYADKTIREFLLNSGATISLGTELLSFSQNSEIVELNTYNSESEKECKYTSRYLIGADGASSLVRKLCGIRLESLGYDKDWIVVDVETNDDHDLGNYAIQVCDPDRMTTFIPFPKPFKRWEFLLLDDEDKHEMMKERKVRELIGPWLESEKYKVIRSASYRFHSVLAKNFQKEKVFLVGDSAHQGPPFMGQGMMSGYRDSINLYWKLNFVLKKSFPENILKTYNVERRPHAQFIVEGSAAIGKLMEAYSIGSRDDTIDEIPEEVINRGYGSFRIPGLEKGILFNQSSCNNPLIGELFPQPIQFHNTKIKERNDKILGDDFSILSKIDINIKKRESIFLNKINAKFIILKDKEIKENQWLSMFMQSSDTYIVRPDRYVFGATTKDISFSDLLTDLQSQLEV